MSGENLITSNNAVGRAGWIWLFARIFTAGILSVGPFFLQCGLTIFSVRQTLKMLDPEIEPRSSTELALTVLTGISTAYVLFFTFYFSTYLKLASYFSRVPEGLIIDEAGDVVVALPRAQLPKILNNVVNLILFAELVNLFFSSYLVTAEVSEIESKPKIYALMTYPFISNCITYFIFTYDMAHNNMTHLYNQFHSGEYNGRKMGLSALSSIFATIAQSISVKFFLQMALKRFPPTENISPELSTGLSITMAILYVPFSASLGFVQMYRFLNHEEPADVTSEVHDKNVSYCQFILILSHYVMQAFYIFCRSSVTFASTLDLISRLSPENLPTSTRSACAVPVVLSYAAYEYFFLCRTGTRNVKKLLNSRFCFFQPQDRESTMEGEMVLLRPS